MDQISGLLRGDSDKIFIYLRYVVFINKLRQISEKASLRICIDWENQKNYARKAERLISNHPIFKGCSFILANINRLRYIGIQCNKETTIKPDRNLFDRIA